MTILTFLQVPVLPPSLVVASTWCVKPLPSDACEWHHCCLLLWISLTISQMWKRVQVLVEVPVGLTVIHMGFTLRECQMCIMLHMGVFQCKTQFEIASNPLLWTKFLWWFFFDNECMDYSIKRNYMFVEIVYLYIFSSKHFLAYHQLTISYCDLNDLQPFFQVMHE